MRQLSRYGDSRRGPGIYDGPLRCLRWQGPRRDLASHPRLPRLVRGVLEREVAGVDVEATRIDVGVVVVRARAREVPFSDYGPRHRRRTPRQGRADPGGTGDGHD